MFVLSGHGVRAMWLQHENITKVLNSRLLCTVCKRDFRSLPALNGHMRSHSGSRAATGTNKVEDSSLLENPSVVMVMPVSMPVQSGGAVKTCKAGQRACSRLSPATGGAVLYRSLLQQEKEEAAVSGDAVVARGDDGGVHYTPPPMLCPLRAGPGLYCSLTTRWQQRAQPVQLHDAHISLITCSRPAVNHRRINVGRSFQAELPPLRRRRGAHSNSHNALLLWTPVEELEHPENQRRVEALMMMACSSVIPGGGASQETALHVLSECRGDFLRTLERMMSTSNNDLTSQQDQSK
ncbi:transcriptional-regulating factor 1-like [Tautogolabrus adspersus]